MNFWTRFRPFIPWLVAASFALLFLSVLLVKQENARLTPISFLPAKPETTPTSEKELVLVTRVIDGDTIEIESGQRVRYIGIDTPESGQCLGSEASVENTKLVGGKKVRLETDIEKQDKYGRMLAYVWVGETLVNEELLLTGLATVTTYPPNVRYVNRFLAAQKEARAAGRGVWDENACAIR